MSARESVLLHMTAPMREDFAIPYHDLGPREERPRLALVAGLHGNELNGVFVLARLANFLAQVASGDRPEARLLARVLVIPAVNVLGLNARSRVWPFDGTDLNRMFPGYDAGETTQRIAAALLRLTEPARWRIDIHSSNVDFEELPQVRLYEPGDEEREAARWLGLPAVVERPVNATFSATLANAWRERGGHSLVIQAGYAGGLQAAHCERLFRALVDFLEGSGLLVGVRLAEPEGDVHAFGVRQSFPMISEHAGWFVSRLEVGQWIQAGELVGYVYDGFRGDLRAEVRSPHSGLLAGIRRQPLLCEGDLLARVLTRDPVGAMADTYLMGHGQ
ncbi:MAG TPA: M14 family metallopeptidase [Myxococcota bacterium]|nr:M14 family metallopeptidase [Myxococcota bacterium]